MILKSWGGKKHVNIHLVRGFSIAMMAMITGGYRRYNLGWMM
jgi:hypothetical protein